MIIVALFATVLFGRSCYGQMDFPLQANSSGVQLGSEKNQSSGVIQPPFFSGFVDELGPYRHLLVFEQTLVMIGEPKHGMWRVQENGFVREYLKNGTEGLMNGTDPNDLNLGKGLLHIIKTNYGSFLPREGRSGHKYPDQHIDKHTGFLNFIDLSIYHSKYGGKYNNHVAIDLPHFYCFMSYDDYPNAKNVWKYAIAQSRANKMGRLAKRAGLDIKELFTNVIALKPFNDASLWANIGRATGDPWKELKNRANTTVNYQRVDRSKLEVEVYLVERVYLNKPELFIVSILENKQGPSEYSYVRPDGAYWKELVKHGKSARFNMSKPNYFPKMHVENYRISGESSAETVLGTPRACPGKGGDYGRFPWSDAGSGWPTNYEEIVPLCWGLAMDLKFWGNLSTEALSDLSLGLLNAGSNSQIYKYEENVTVYGKYTDPYLTKMDARNPYEVDLTGNGQPVKWDDYPKPNPIEWQINFTRIGTNFKYNNVSGLT